MTLTFFIHILKYIHVFHFGFEVNCKENILNQLNLAITTRQKIILLCGNVYHSRCTNLTLLVLGRKLYYWAETVIILKCTVPT